MLERFLHELGKVLPDFEKQGMRPGASDTEINIIEEALAPLGLTTELQNLYCWHNGSSTEFFPEVPVFGFRFLSLQESLETIKMLGTDPFAKDWVKQFLPVGDMEGTILLATLRNLDNNRSQIFQYVIEDGNAYLMHQSIQAMIQTATFVWTTQAVQGQSFSDARLLFSPEAYIETQKGLTSRSGIENVFDFSISLPEHLE